MTAFRTNDRFIGLRSSVLGARFATTWRPRDRDRIPILQAELGRIQGQQAARKNLSLYYQSLEYPPDSSRRVEDALFLATYDVGNDGSRIAASLDEDLIALVRTLIGQPVALTANFSLPGETTQYEVELVGWIGGITDSGDVGILANSTASTLVTIADYTGTTESVRLARNINNLPLTDAYIITQSGRVDSDGTVQPDLGVSRGGIVLASPFELDGTFDVKFSARILSSTVRAPVRDPSDARLILAGEHRLSVEVADRFELGLADTPPDLDEARNIRVKLGGIQFRLVNFLETDGMRVICELVRVS